MSPRRRKAEDLDVFAALVRVMLRRGPAELTLGAIAAEAGVTAGALVQRFGSKRQLLHAHAVVAVALALAVPTFAQKPADAPKNATVQCTDDTFSTAKTQQGACSHDLPGGPR